ncbi:MAG TPA: penicillin acylase family protein [Thermomicrobiales bacterium]|nr:penicillin acylase family protein [Thermomicrobiales bacterium]
MSGPVSISRDRYGIPRISAGSREDALFGLGYAVAEDRMFQMDTLRRTAFGRLSELAGPVTLETDRMMRLLDMERIAGEMVACASDSARAGLEAFAAGVNLRLSRRSVPLEFRILRYKPEPWRPEDSAAIVRLMGWSLSAFHTNDLTAALLRDTIGDEWADAIYAGRTAESPLVVQERSRRPGEVASVAPAPIPFPHGGASNAWAISAERSTTGFPLLANDPHLGYTNPSIWCEVSIDAPNLRISGLTLPGVPGIAFGRTPTFAWGFTAAMISQTFLYRERLSDLGGQVADGEELIDLTTRTEQIQVKGAPTETLVIRSTPRGPLISDLQTDSSADPISLYWTGFETHPEELDGWLALSESTSVEDVLRARESIIAPTLNMAAADSSGEIASIGIGRWPDRRPFAGLLDPSEHPPRYIPPSDMPVERNPERGWVASANNPIVGSDYPYALHGYYEPNYRIRRISAMLDSRPKHSVADMRALQLDQLSLHASDVTPFLLELGGDAIPDWARSDLSGWDFLTPPESRPTLLFQVFYRHWVQASLAHRLPDNVVDRLIAGLGVGDTPMGFCDRLLRGEHAGWWLDDARERIVRESFAAALDWIAERLGQDHSPWTWGAVHTVTWSHPFGQIEGRHQAWVNVGPFPLGGDRTTVWPTGYDAHRPFHVTAGPSMRLLADLRRPERTWVTNTLGQQGRPFSRHYRDQVTDFIEGRSHPVWGQTTRTRVVIEPE